MNEEQIKALLESFKTDILADVDKKNSGLAANISKDVKKVLAEITSTNKTTEDSTTETNTGDTKDNLSLKALQTELESLKAERDKEKAEVIQSKKSSAVIEAATKAGVLKPNVFKQLYLTNFDGSLKEENGKWFVSDGDNVTPIENHIKSYLDSEDGSIFVPASNTEGAGSKPNMLNSKTSSTKPAANSLDAFADALVNLT